MKDYVSFNMVNVKNILRNKKIRLFFHTDLDGTISANLIQLFSGADIVKFVPCPFQNFPKSEKPEGIDLDVFVDCRSRNRDEDVRIDHHMSGEDEEYLKRENIIVDPSYKSAVSLVAHYLGIKINKQVLEEMDKADSGQKNVFSKFKMDNHTIHKILINDTHKFKPRDYEDYEIFKDKLLNFMERGFAIEDLGDTPTGYEEKMEIEYKVVVEDIKKEGKPLIKVIHSPTSEGIFLEKVFKITDNDFFGHILPYVNQHYEKECEKTGIGAYVIVGFRARNYEFDEKLIKVVKDNHPEPYQLFVKRSGVNANLNIGNIITEVKNKVGITNGGGRDSVGGINTSDKKKAIQALRLITQIIKEKC